MENGDVQIREFAAVMIPTLCRYNHFRNCMESLMKCKWAKETDVYVGLDFPAKESHKEGHKKISDYLTRLEKDNPFKNLIIIRREKNLGIGPNGNAASLRKHVLKHHDRIIFTEDDNIFSPAFLDFINKGLEIYEDDKSIEAICGYRHYYPILFHENTIYRQHIDFSAWGYATWKDRIMEIREISPKWFRDRLSIKSFHHIRKRGGNRRALQLLRLAYMENSKFTVTDNVISVYMMLTNKDVMMPGVSCVRNMGTDGSGENFHSHNKKLQTRHSTQPLFVENMYEIKGDPFKYYEDNNRIHRDFSYKKLGTLRFLTMSATTLMKAALKKITRKI